MRIQRPTTKIILFLCVSALITPNIFAENNAGFIYSLHKTDKNILERRDVQEAVNRFAQMLSISPQGRTVEDNLNTIMLHPGLTAAQQSDVLLLGDLLRTIENLQVRIDYLISKRNRLKHRLIEKGHDRKELSEDLLYIRNNVSRSSQAFFYHKQPSLNRYNPLVIMNLLLAEEKTELSVRVRSLEDQYDWLKAINKDGRYVSPYYSPFERISDSISTEHVVEIIPQENIILVQEEESGDQIFSDSRAEAFKKEMGSLYGELDKLQERIGEEDGKIDALASQVVDLSLKLSETEMLLNEKAETIAFLRAKLNDVEQRFMLGERIIHEKDSEIQLLQKDLQFVRLDAGTQKEKLKDVLILKDRHLAELEAFLRIYREGLIRSRKDIRVKADNLNYAKKEIAALRLQANIGYKTERGKMPKGQADPGRHSVRSSKADEQGRHLSNIVESKDEKLIELSGILEIYRDKLGNGAKTIKKNMMDIDALEQQLDFMKDELQEKSKELMGTQRNLFDLEGQLTVMKNELLKLKSLPDQSGSEG